VRLFVSSFCLCLALAAGGARAQSAPPELIRLHEALHLTASQEAAWTTYVAAIAPTPQARARHLATAQLLPQLTTPKRIALIDATMTQDDVDFRQQGLAVTAFYSSLTPSQQRTFDMETLPTQSGGERPMGAEPSRSAPNPPLQMPPNP
jgi:hypothetical protein